MLRSLFSGITGLNANQQLMDVVSNNIANVNTTGFKSSNIEFEDTLSQTLSASSAPTTTTGGVNPAQIGLGVQTAGITTDFSQGSAQNTGTSTDLMIQGDGFFMTSNGGTTSYTRNGSFKFDSNGDLVTSDGSFVQGWTASNGTVSTTGTVGNITIPSSTTIPPTASTTVTLSGNMLSSTTTATTLSAKVYDASGTAHTLSVVLTPNTTTTPQSYDVSVTEPADSTVTAGTGSAQFLSATAAAALTPAGVTGAYDSTNSTEPSVTLSDGTSIKIDLSGLTQYGGSQSASVTKIDGAASGSLESYQIADDGSIVGTFSNGQKLTLAQVALANFNNPAGLEKVGDTSFQATTNSGLPQVGTANSGGRGSLLAGSVEMSNVDLASQFTNLIVAQRGFEANARVITSADQLLQDLVDIKR